MSQSRSCYARTCGDTARIVGAGLPWTSTASRGREGTPDAVRSCGRPALPGMAVPLSSPLPQEPACVVRRGLLALVVVFRLAGDASAENAIRWTPGEGAFLPGNVWIGADVTFAAEIPEEGP